MKILKIVLITLTLGLFTSVSAQNKKGKLDDISRIAITSYIPNFRDIPNNAKSLLTKKLSSLVTKSGMGGTSIDDRFIITADIEEITKDITPTAPPMFAYNLQADVYIVDFKSRKIYGQETIPLKGVGTTETKAYLAGIKRINPSNKVLANFVKESKDKIVEYYNSQCDFIIKKAESLSNLDKSEEAISTLMSVPEVCKECYEKALDATKPIYQKHINRTCNIQLQNAKNVWNANQNSEGAEDAARFLSTIDPKADCYNDAKAFSDQIGAAIKKLDDRDWDFKMKVYEDELELAQKALDLEGKRIDSNVEISSNYAKAYTAAQKYEVDAMRNIATTYLSTNQQNKKDVDLSWLFN